MYIHIKKTPGLKKHFYLFKQIFSVSEWNDMKDLKLSPSPLEMKKKKKKN